VISSGGDYGCFCFCFCFHPCHLASISCSCCWQRQKFEVSIGSTDDGQTSPYFRHFIFPPFLLNLPPIFEFEKFSWGLRECADFPGKLQNCEKMFQFPFKIQKFSTWESVLNMEKGERLNCSKYSKSLKILLNCSTVSHFPVRMPNFRSLPGKLAFFRENAPFPRQS